MPKRRPPHRRGTWLGEYRFADGLGVPGPGMGERRRDASQVIRVLLTGATRSPDIAAVADVPGTSEVLRRATALAS